MAGVFVSQVLTGAIIGLFPLLPDGSYPLLAYRSIFALQACWMAVAILPYLRTRDPLHDQHM
jgi:hypothetical protein